MPATAGLLPDGVRTPDELAARLAEHDYLADPGLATAAFLALRLQRPLLCEGEAGVGKTELAKVLATVLDAPLVRLQCYEGIDAAQALYDWDFPRQLLHLRAAEAVQARGAAGGQDSPREGGPREDGSREDTATAVARLEGELWDRRFLLARPLLAALETTPCVLLVDEVDRADDEFEAFLLEVLSDYAVTVPELGTLRADVPPVVVLTSNRTRDVHDALKRRCLYAWVDLPSFAREVEIVRRRVPAASELLARQVTAAVGSLRAADLVKPPGIAETIDWTSAVVALGAEQLDPDTAAVTLGAVLKHREDVARARALDLASVLAEVG